MTPVVKATFGKNGKGRARAQGGAVCVFWVTAGHPPLQKRFSDNLRMIKMFQAIGSLTMQQPRIENMD